MNYLAHVYLSGENELIRVGNFLGDWVKGSDYKKYPMELQRGILIHRFIDNFTDTHEIGKKSKIRFASKYHKYAGVIVDICYDHFLASDWHNFSPVPLLDYSLGIKKGLLSHRHYFPVPAQEYILNFTKYNWLYAYATVEGIEKVLRGMAKYTSLPDKTDEAMIIFNEEYDEFRSEFMTFFPQLIDYIENEFNIDVRCQMRAVN
jgi:acyl carrier protein phosphodiesterase